MVRTWTCVAALAAVGLFVSAQDDMKGKREHIILTPDDIKWGDAPPSLPAGAKAAVLEGDMKKEGFFAIRLKLPAGYKLQPHWHPGDERVTVISGKFHVGLGEAFDESKMKALPAGSFVSLPPKTAHFAMVSEDTVIQLTTLGPWGITYLKPEDDPRNKK